MLINDWILAFRVCKKYGIKWSIFHNMKSAEASFSFNGQEKIVFINPFYKGFIDSFMHEVGHLVRWDRIYRESVEINKKDRKERKITLLNPVANFKLKTSCILKEEYMAWKFSKRFLKNRFDKKRAKNFFKTYYTQSIKEIGIQKATDAYYAYDKNI